MEFERVYHEYFRDVYIFMRGLSGDEHVAEEVTQEIFVKAMKSIDSFDGRKDIRAWLFTIAKNTYYTLYRKQKLYAEEDIPEKIYYAGFDGSKWKNDPSSETAAAIENGQLVWDGN